MADEILTNDGLALAVTEYKELIPGDGITIENDVISVVGKMDESKLAIEDDIIKSYDGKSFGGSSGSDETVLFIDNNPSTSTRSYTLSEASTNFEYLKVFYKHVDGGNFISFFPGDSNTWVCNSFITGDQGLWLAATSYTSTDYLTFTLWRNWNFGFTPSTQRENARKHLVSKVVGINRKEGV